MIEINLSLGDIGNLLQEPRFLLLIIIFLVWQIIKDLPAILRGKSLIFIPIAKKLKFSFLQKEAIKSDIQGTVNYAVKPLIKELPKGSLKPLDLKYVNSTKRESFIRDRKIFVRIRPVENQTNNFLNVLNLYLEVALLPNSKNLLSEAQKRSVIYFTATRVIENRKRLNKKLYEEYYVPDTKNIKGLKLYFEKIFKIDKRGLFFGVGLRVIERGAGNLYFKHGSLEEEFDKVLNHITGFVEALDKRKKSKEIWQYINPDISFSLLLVADPFKIMIVKPQSYARRLEDNLKTTELVFVVFSKEEWLYGKRVVEAIKVQGKAKLIETIETKYDYRGKKGGLIKLYCKKRRFS